MKHALEIASRRTDEWLGDLIECLRIPSISTLPDHAEDVAACADWIVAHLKGMGIDGVRAERTDGHPIITGEHIVDAAKPTILVYGHYDVQPPDPLDLWTSPPFEPAIRDGKIYARGAMDDKGQLFMILKAIQAWQESDDELPVNLKFAIEGEEESNSASLEPFLTANRDALSCDTVLVCDTTMIDATTPTITCSLRGMAYIQVDLTGAEGDLHSGAFGGTVVNTLHVLGDLIASLHDSDNRVTVAGFYDDVAAVTDAVRKQVSEIPFDKDKWREGARNSLARTEAGYSIIEANTIRPCLDVNGVWGGYQGEGAKTVIAGKGGVKLSSRLVADQEPMDIYRKVRAHVLSRVPEGFQVDVRLIGAGSPVSVDTDSPAIRAASAALEETFGRPPVMNRSGGSIPAIALFREILGVPGTLIGFGLKTDNIHAPDEHFGVDRFENGVQTLIRFFDRFGSAAG